MMMQTILPQANFSTPSLTRFNPRVIPYQHQVIKDVRKNFDYGLGKHELLLSGSVGSAKSILMAHLACTHCLFNERARFGLGRKSMPDLKSTIFTKILEHLETDLVEGEDYEVNQTNAFIKFQNGSEIISRSWSDKRYAKWRSLELSAGALEELTENNDEDKQAYDEFAMRIGRLGHVREKFLISATNPDSPAHWGYKYFILSKIPTRHVYYSVTTDNPFLDPAYIANLKENLDPKMAERMIYGKWIEIRGEVIYYEYDRDTHFKDFDYKVRERLPIDFSFDFNIGEGKPLSSVFYQISPPDQSIGELEHFHIFDESVIFGAKTLDVLEDAAARGLFEHKTLYRLHGDHSGYHSDTRNNISDYEIIETFLNRYRTRDGRRIQWVNEVLANNPPVRERHNTMNAYMKNANGDVRMSVYRKAKTVDEALRLTKLKKGAEYCEDDSKYYQHIGTALGYGLYFYELTKTAKKTRTISQ